MIYDTRQLETIEPKRLLSIFAGSDDWDAELTMLWGDFQVRSHVTIHKLETGDWDILSLQINKDANYGITQWFTGDDLSAYDNKNEIVNALCKLYDEQFANRTEWQHLQIIYPDGNPVDKNT